MRVGKPIETNPIEKGQSTMDKIRVSKSIMDSLNKTGYAVGKKYAYKVHDKLSPDCIVVERIPRYYYHDGINPGPRVCTVDYARRHGLLDVLQVKGA